MKKILITSIAIIAAYTYAFADSKGNCGEKVYWTFEDATNTLTIEGSGDMYDYDEGKDGFRPGYLTIPAIKDNIKTVIVKGSVTNIGARMFAGCTNLETITLPACNMGIGTQAFENCASLKSITIPQSTRYVGYAIFMGCANLTKIEVSDKNIYFDSRNGCNAMISKSTNTLVAGCSTTIIPSDVTGFGFDAFKGSSIESITIPESINEISWATFQDCKQLKSVVLPSTITSISTGAFLGCSNLQNIVVNTNALPTCSIEAFKDANTNTCVVYVPDPWECKEYLNAEGWKDFKNFAPIEKDEEDATRKLCDTNQDGEVNVTDVVRIYNYIITGK